MTTATALETTAATDLGTLRDEQARLRTQLRRSRNRLQLQMALEFVLDELFGLVVVAVILVALDYWLRLGLTTRQVLLYLGLLPWLLC